MNMRYTSVPGDGIHRVGPVQALRRHHAGPYAGRQSRNSFRRASACDHSARWETASETF
jgi:hypothetical protein